MPIKKEPLIQKCCECQGEVVVKFVPPLKSYARKLNWGYWTEKEENKDKYKCWECITNFYYQKHLDYLQEIKSERKRRLLRYYLSMDNRELE